MKKTVNKKTVKTVKAKTTVTPWMPISKGIRMRTNKLNKNEYNVRKMIKGTKITMMFTSKAKAIAYYKSLA